MTDWLLAHGHPALFVLSFLASTLLPVGSEPLLVALLLQGADPWVTVGVATAGNTLGACTTYAVGLLGSPFLVRRVLRLDEAAQRKAEALYARLGSWSLLLSWVPVVGDPLCLAGGLFRVHFGRFALLVAAGKLARYAAVALLVPAGGSLFG